MRRQQRLGTFCAVSQVGRGRPHTRMPSAARGAVGTSSTAGWEVVLEIVEEEERGRKREEEEQRMEARRRREEERGQGE